MPIAIITDHPLAGPYGTAVVIILGLIFVVTFGYFLWRGRDFEPELVERREREE
ncbi:MAG: hypothetical protein AAF614_12465 [Chloroflexota bacterium]